MNTDIQRAQSALQYLNAHDREEWYEAAMMLKSEFGEIAFDSWNDWSQQADNYKASDAMSVWKSCKTSGRLTIATLFYRAKQNGWIDDSKPVMPSPAELAARALSRRIQQQQADNEREHQQAVTAAKAIYLWQKALPANPNHPYLQAKQIKPFDLRQRGAALVIPIVANGQLVNLQFIQPDGEKRFLKGGQVAGAYVPVGQHDDLIYICEGYATGATIHQMTGKGVLCALNAGNLISIAQQARKTCPAAHIVICADNDHQATENTGVDAARKAAAVVNAELMIPEFPPDHHGTDWNDYHLMMQGGAQ